MRVIPLPTTEAARTAESLLIVASPRPQPNTHYIASFDDSFSYALPVSLFIMDSTAIEHSGLIIFVFLAFSCNSCGPHCVISLFTMHLCRALCSVLLRVPCSSVCVCLPVRGREEVVSGKENIYFADDFGGIDCRRGSGACGLFLVC